MGIILPDLIIETTIRDGLEFLKQNPETIDDIFSELLQGYASRKYGSTEIDRIKTYIANNEIAVVHSFHEASAKTPCYSLQLGAEHEAKERTIMGDFSEDVQEPLDAAALALLVKVPAFIPDSYDPITGKVEVDDAYDLEDVYPGHLYEDGDGTTFVIQSGISNQTGDKFFFLLKNQSPNIVDPGQIKSFIDQEQYERKNTTSQVMILVGVHSKEALLTKYMYAILKYILLSRKDDLIKRCFIVSTFRGSDFNRNMAYQGDQVFSRFYEAMGTVDDTWRSDNVDLIDSVEINATPVDCPDDES